jgi:hypothetical protein
LGLKETKIFFEMGLDRANQFEALLVNARADAGAAR